MARWAGAFPGSSTDSARVWVHLCGGRVVLKMCDGTRGGRVAFDLCGQWRGGTGIYAAVVLAGAVGGFAGGGVVATGGDRRAVYAGAVVSIFGDQSRRCFGDDARDGDEIGVGGADEQPVARADHPVGVVDRGRVGRGGGGVARAGARRATPSARVQYHVDLGGRVAFFAK